MPNQEEGNERIDDTKLEGMTTMLRELMRGNRGLELSIEPRDDEGGNNMEDLRVDTAFKYEDYANHLNLDCLNLDDNDEGNSSPFETLATKMTKLTPDGGVMKRIKRNGSGNAMPERSLVWLHYNMYLELEEVPFDSSYLRSSKYSFKLRLGEGLVIPGFEMAVASMAVGEKSQFLIQSHYGFGAMGIPPRIPPNATILLEVDVIKSVSGDVDIEESGAEDQDLKDFKTAFRKAKVLHLKGNTSYQNNSYLHATDDYRKAVNLLTSCSLNSDEEEANQIKLLLKLYRNLCVCYNKLNMPERVCLAARDAVNTDPFSTNFDAKLHFNWGKALVKLSSFSKAAEHLRKAQSIDPNCQAITKELVALEDKRKAQLRHEKITYKKALGLRDSTKAAPEPADSFNHNKKDESLEKELEEFAQSGRSRMELPTGVTGEEKQFVRLKARQLGLEYKEIKRNTGEVVVAICK